MGSWKEWKESLGDTRPWHLLDPSIARALPEIAEKRLAICKACPEFIPITHQCKKCLCIMDGKTKLASSSCPIGKWGPVET